MKDENNIKRKGFVYSAQYIKTHFILLASSAVFMIVLFACEVLSSEIGSLLSVIQFSVFVIIFMLLIASTRSCALFKYYVKKDSVAIKFGNILIKEISLQDAKISAKSFITEYGYVGQPGVKTSKALRDTYILVAAPDVDLEDFDVAIEFRHILKKENVIPIPYEAKDALIIYEEKSPIKEGGQYTTDALVSKTSRMTETSTDGAFKLNEVAVFKNLKFSAIEIIENDGNDIFTPKAGRVFVGIKFTIDNISCVKQKINSIMLFDAYCDGLKLKYSFGAEQAYNAVLDVEIANGEKITGCYALDAPKDWHKIELIIRPDLLSTSVATFVFNK